MKAVLVIALAASVLFGVGYLYWGAEQPVEVAIVSVEPADVTDVLVTNGRIEAGDRLDVYAETSGRVLRVPVSVGEAVTKGALLAAIDNQGAQAELAQSQARLDSARAELARAVGALDSHAVTGRTWVSPRSAIDVCHRRCRWRSSEERGLAHRAPPCATTTRVRRKITKDA